MDFPIWTFLKLLCIVTPARVVLDRGVLVHGGARACARARPRESSPTMHRVLVLRGARPRESSPIMAPGDYTRSNQVPWNKMYFLISVSLWRGTKHNFARCTAGV